MSIKIACNMGKKCSMEFFINQTTVYKYSDRLLHLMNSEMGGAMISIPPKDFRLFSAASSMKWDYYPIDGIIRYHYLKNIYGVDMVPSEYTHDKAKSFLKLLQ